MGTCERVQVDGGAIFLLVGPPEGVQLTCGWLNISWRLSPRWLIVVHRLVDLGRWQEAFPLSHPSQHTPLECMQGRLQPCRSMAKNILIEMQA